MTPSAIATLAVVSVIASAFVQFLKKRARGHALVWLAVVSIVAASGYSVVTGMPWWDAVKERGSLVLLTANAIYNVFKAFYELRGGDDSEAQLDA